MSEGLHMQTDMQTSKDMQTTLDAPVAVPLPGVSPEVAAKLAAADAAMAAGAPLDPGAGVRVAPSQAEEIAAILHLGGQGAGLMFPSVAPIYSEGRCKDVAEKVAPVLERLGIKIPFGSAGLYGGAIMAVLALAWETRAAVLRDLEREAREAKREQAKRIEAGEVGPTVAPVVERAPEHAILRPVGGAP